tara:strand:- start:97 stop:414 length:318 start_codon:yes stop_codon:yes gene_type:complete
MLPDTVSFSFGVAVPIPTRPEVSIAILVAPALRSRIPNPPTGMPTVGEVPPVFSNQLLPPDEVFSSLNCVSAVLLDVNRIDSFPPSLTVNLWLGLVVPIPTLQAK